MKSKSKSPTTSAEHVYVYAAVEGAPATLPAHGMPSGARPHLIALDDQVSLVASTVPAGEYSGPAIDARLGDLDWMSQAGAAHHAVVDALAAAGRVVLPFRLLTIYSSEAKATEALAARLPAIRRAFDRVRGREEWVLRIGRPDLARRAPAAMPADARASGTSFLAAKAAARRDDAARAARVVEGAAACYEALARLADAAVRKDVDPRGGLILDAALLVQPSTIETMKQTLTRAADTLLQDGCAVSFTGPWPPYSFASLDETNDG